MLRVDAVHRGEVTHVLKKDTGAHDIIEAPAGRLQDRRQVLEDALRFGLDPPLDHLAGRRILADLSAEEEETVDLDRLGEWAHRRRELRRGNCGLAHSNSCSLLP